MRLTDRFDDIVDFDGNELELNLAFDIVLRSRELLKDPIFSNSEKINLLFKMFVKNYDEYEISMADKNEIISFIFNEFIEDKEGKQTGTGSSEKVYDLEYDAKYIYASFLQDYSIDLFKEQGKMHWKKFKALMAGFTEHTKFSEVLNIRQQKVPMPTKHNQDEIKRIRELKRIYRLEAEYSEDQVKGADQKLAEFSKGLKAEYMRKQNK